MKLEARSLRLIVGILLLFGMFIGIVSSAPYQISNPKFTEGIKYSSFGGIQETGMEINPDMCQEGQDFIVQIAPFGCSPAVVRSDLLEEQDVPVFCELQAVKINPLINIESIQSISFGGSEYPSEVRTIGFHPVYDALGGNRKLNNMMWDNIGYATFILNRQANESALRNCEKAELGTEVCWIEGNLSARINYDIEGGFGLKKHTFYLPVMTDKEFSRKMGQYEFFDGRGYLRAEDVTDESATISVYSGMLESPYSEGSYQKQATQRYTLNSGQTTPKLLLPGLDCLAAVEFRLDKIDSTDTIVKLRVNSQSIEVKEGEPFLDERCSVRELKKFGLNQEVKIRCEGDDRTESFNLYISPSIMLRVGNEQKAFTVGEKIFETNGGEKAVYLAQVVMQDGNEENLSAYFIESPTIKDKLTSEDMFTANYIAESYSTSPERLSDWLNKISAGVAEFGHWLFNNVKVDGVDFGVPEDVFGENIEILGFGTEMDSVLTGDVKRYYGLAVDDYEIIYDTFSGEKYPKTDVPTIDERALYNQIKLNFDLGKKREVKLLCNQFEEYFSKSKLGTPEECRNVVELANVEVSTKDVIIDGDVKRISFDGINEPAYEDYGAAILITGKDNAGFRELVHLRKDRVYYMDQSKNEFIKLVEVRDDSVDIMLSVNKKSIGSNVYDILISNVFTLKKDDPTSFGSDYVFTLSDTNLKKVAKVSINPSVNALGSEVEFPFKIGVEKRSIQLSPEKTQNRIDTLNETIEKWDGISNSLGTIVEDMKKACLITGGFFTAKNLLFGSSGESLARQEVMRGENGWHEICSEAVANKTYTSMDQCFLRNSDAIDDQVDQVLSAMSSQNNYIKNTQETTKDGLLGQKVANTEKLTVDYAQELAKGISGEKMLNPERPSESVNMIIVKEALSNSKNYEDGVYDLEDLKQIDLYANLLQQDPNNKVYEKRLYTALKQIELNYEDVASIRMAEERVSSIGVSGMSFRPWDRDNSKKQEIYEGKILTSALGQIPVGSPIQGISFNNREYIVTLKDLNVENSYRIEQIYDLDGRVVSENRSILNSYGTFIKVDRAYYKNKIKDIKVQYYETEPYKGLPALVPVDVNDGWYAYVKQTISVAGNIRTYDDSGRVNSFYLCNVGKNGLVEFNSQSVGDDICQMINLAGAYTNNFPGLTESETAKLVDNSVKAIYEASRMYKDKISTVSILGQSVRVGEPALDLPATQCADFMSPKECQIMFNVCDPVICPSSRCDFGGAYPVQDVVQSGIVGSLALCLPNVNEGIYIPVCLTGVKAGIDGLLSVFGAYRDCLDHSLQTGEQIGICDEIHSIYLCEFFWRQGLPLAKLAIPKLLSIVSGEKTARGGGEYSGVESAWANAQDSVSFFVENYAVNAYKAFKARSQDEVGSAVCKSFVSLSYPNGQGFWDVLTEADSPHQFTANFEEIPFSSATNPPTSQYKVFYHIYAGNDRGAYFRVYLRGGTSSSYYQDTDVGRMVDSGYIATGQSATQSIDFTAPSGYKELCVQVNEQMECGFKQVSTNFAQNYVRDQYLERQAKETNIKTEKECISGSASLGGLLNLNIQEGVSNAIDPQLYNQGIIRVCSTDNPGSGSDPYINTERQRWQEVGICGSQSMKCWIDTETIDDAMNFEISADQTLDVLTENYLDKFASDNNYLDEGKFAAVVENITAEKDLMKKLSMIESIFDKVFMNSHKAYLFLLRGDTFGDLAREKYKLTGPCARKDEYLAALSSWYSSANKNGDNFEVEVIRSQIIPFEVAYQMVLEDKCLVNLKGPNGDTLLHNHWRAQEGKEAEIVKSLILLGGDINLKNEYGDTPFLSAVKIGSFEVVKIMVEDGRADLLYYPESVVEDDGLLYLAKLNQDVRVYDYLAELLKQSKSSLYGSEYTSTKLKFSDGSITKNLCYSFFGGVWHWTDDCSNVGRERVQTDPELGIVVNRYVVKWKELSQASEAPSSSNVNFIESLRGKSYAEGLNLLLTRTINNQDSGWFSNSDLSNDLTSFNHKGVFVVDSRPGLESGMKFMFNQSDDSWYWAYGSENRPDKNVWIKTPSLETHPIFAGAQKTEVEKKLIQILGTILGENAFLEGSMVLFSSEREINSMDFSENGNVITPESSTDLDKFFSVVNSMVGEIPSEEESCSIDGAGAANCYNALMVAYERAGYDYKNNKCIYSAKRGEKFIVNGHENLMTADAPFWANSEGTCTYTGMSETDKLNLLKPGHQLDLIVGNKLPHSVMFVNWSNRASNLAVVFDWGYFKSEGRKYSYSVVDLSDDKNPIYKIREYPLYSTSIKEVTVAPSGSQVRTSEEISAAGISMTEFSEDDRKTFYVAQSCEDCGYYGTCQKDECLAIGKLVGKNCEYSVWRIGNRCVEDNTNSFSMTCNSDSECQKLLGEEVMKIAKEIKADQTMSEINLKSELGIPSFECLAVMIAMQESNLKFCEKYQENGNPLYCEGDSSKVLGTTDKGIMQLNSAYVGVAGGYVQTDIERFENNVRAGLEKLKKDYQSAPSVTKQPKLFSCPPIVETYYGWEYALRSYNGWACTGDNNYIRNVRNKQDAVAKIFPECSRVEPKSIVDQVKDLRGEKWTFSNALVAVKILEGDFDTNSWFVDQLYQDLDGSCEQCMTYGDYELIYEKRAMSFLEDYLESKVSGN